MPGWLHLPDLLVLLVAEPTLVVAYVVFGMVGFGTTLVSAPLLAHVLPLSTVVPALALTDFVASWTNGLRLGAHVVRKEVLRLVPAMVIGSALGAWLLFAVPVPTLMLLLGVFVVLYALNGLRPKAPQPPLAAGWAWWYGGAGGVLSALFGAGGWVYSMYLLRRLEDPQQIRATQTAVLTISSTIRVGLFLVAGTYFNPALLLLVLALLPAMVLGLYIGHRITLRLDRKRFLQVLYGVLLLTGGSLVWRVL
ncbi:sulfite exporter TauE/SafE family protein [Caenimonas terrae]|uniref:Probable membrane transporter protein n=1 Tax=Caenimonas terrae TaxID=696074 RepID=A0ABW0NHQ9_9BURK